MKDKLPELKSFRLLGHLKEYVKDPYNFMLENSKKYPNGFTFRIATKKLTYINRPDLIKYVIQENNKNYRKGLAYQKLGAVLGNGLLTSDGELWKNRRRACQGSFTKNQLEGYKARMFSITEETVSGYSKNTPVDLLNFTTDLTLKIISNTLLGIRLHNEVKVIEKNLPFLLQQMIKRITNPLSIPLSIPTKTNKEFNKKVKEIEDLILSILTSEKEREENLIDHLKEYFEQKEGSLEGLKDEVITFFIAGHETTAIGLFWSIFEIERNPYIKQALKNELATVSEEKLLDHISNSELLENIFSEALRMHCPVWVISRQSIDKDSIKGFNIPKNANILISPLIVQNSESLWENPNKFNPDRFKESTAPYSYFPFGGGPRLCIGKEFSLIEAKIILGYLYKKQCLQIADLKEPKKEFSLTLRPKTPVSVKFL